MFPRFLTNVISWYSVFILSVIAAVFQILSFLVSWQSDDHALKLHFFKKSARLSSNLHLGDKVSDDHTNILASIAKWSVLDSSGEYRIAESILIGDKNQKLKEKYFENLKKGRLDLEENSEKTSGIIAVTLVTHCSASKLKYLPNLTEKWQGPLSVSLFALSSEVQASVQLVLLLRKCYPSVKDNVTFSLIFPLNSPTSPHIVPTPDTTPCHEMFSDVSRGNYYFDGVQYPNNLLRNIARKQVDSAFMMVVDIDMIPSPNLSNSFIEYMTKSELGTSKLVDSKKTIWVVPVYEVAQGCKAPQDKKELLYLKQNGKARPFYYEVCWKCQKYTDYSSWEQSDDKTVKPLYDILWHDPWEPFYISYNTVPAYDERFRQYGFNRISQVCELHVAGYRFIVLDNVFLIHDGFKTVDTFHTSKDTEQEHNRGIFRRFKNDLKIRYPESSRRCY